MRATEAKALIVTVDRGWGSACARVFKHRGCTVETAVSGSAALGLMRKRVYDYVAVDDSLPDFDPIEFGLSTRDAAPNRPELLVGLHSLSALQRIAGPCNVVYAGPKERVIAAIPQFLDEEGEGSRGPQR